MRTWLNDWWITLRYGSVFTRAGRELRRGIRDIDDPNAWVEVCPVTRLVECPWHPDGGNHPDVGTAR